MADYYPLIARAVANLPQNTDAARRALYERARRALSAQLGRQSPTLSAADVNRERQSLDEAIRKVEMEAGDQPRSAPRHAAALLDELPNTAASNDPPVRQENGNRRRRTVLVAGGLLASALIVAIGVFAATRMQTASACAPSYPKADTVVIDTGGITTMSGAIAIAIGGPGMTAAQSMPAGPIVVWVVRNITDKESKELSKAGYDFRSGSAYIWRQSGTAPFDWSALKDVKYLCDFDTSLTDEQIIAAFLHKASK
jgi:hypothetical protein